MKKDHLKQNTFCTTLTVQPALKQKSTRLIWVFIAPGMYNFGLDPILTTLPDLPDLPVCLCLVEREIHTVKSRVLASLV